MNRITTIFITCLTIVYFAFTSGLVYWASRCEVTDRFIVPFSWALNADAGYAPIATKGDIDCVQWLVDESNQDMSVASDANGLFFIVGHMKVGTGAAVVVEGNIHKGRWYWMDDVFTKGDCYLFLTDWDIKHGKYIICNDVGLRRHFYFNISDNGSEYLTYTADVPIYLSNIILDKSVYKEALIKEVYKSGNSIVYEVVDN